MKKHAWILIMAIATGSVSTAIAQGGPRGRGPGGPGGPFPMAWLADATDAQREQARAILDEARGSRQGPPPALTLRRQVGGALLAAPPDGPQLESLRPP